MGVIFFEETFFRVGLNGRLGTYAVVQGSFFFRQTASTEAI